jgi:AcrR family transcriptional regulator
VPPSAADTAPLAQPKRPRRADAQRNYELLLRAAKELFNERGVDVPLDDIARRAGVGNATMYRHFPTRQEMIIAVYADEVAVLCAHGDALRTERSPGDALFSWLKAFIAHVATKRQLALALPNDRGGRRSELFDRWHEAMRAQASALLSRAQESGAVRTDVVVSDLLALAHGIALTGVDADQTHRLLRIIRHGTDPSSPQ